ncbi:GDSL-type esterase/lipase family protein [Phycicoccus sp. 3266]|uniref:GDSL-type esterase/lipase family protein n=1 Tax=Phycicoccus sp. 3266 TaxID=2817751 RepID=UPI00285662DE|nr:GDSL-type esterase/lipase family protein [Phycicoccus sp. 3266]MDR6863061.1 lysophospholipase L1-like esterase [Phycicoccus sp. 3266]
MRRSRAGALAALLVAAVVGGGAALAVAQHDGDSAGASPATSLPTATGRVTATAPAASGTSAPGTTPGARGAPSTAGGRSGVRTVIVLGDSYSAGNGAGGSTGACYRSPRSATRLYAAAVGARVVDASCSGAVVNDLVSPDRAGNPAQDSVVDQRADVVVLTMGGNDVGFGDIVTECFLLASGSRPGGCADGVSRARSLLPQVQAALTDALVQVRSRMRPDAVLVLRAYPLLAPNRPFVQQGGYDADAGVRALGTDGVAMQDRVVRAVRSRVPGGAGVRTYLDTSALRLFAGHELGSGRSTGTGTPGGKASVPWFDGFQTPGADAADVYHPNALGQAAWGQSLRTFLAPLTR